MMFTNTKAFPGGGRWLGDVQSNFLAYSVAETDEVVKKTNGTQKAPTCHIFSNLIHVPKWSFSVVIQQFFGVFLFKITGYFKYFFGI